VVTIVVTENADLTQDQNIAVELGSADQLLPGLSENG
jgi:hypothetical protein